MVKFTRIFFGLLGFSAIITELVVLLERGTFDAGNFFSFFTILSNILAAAFLIFASVASEKVWTSKRTQQVRGAVTLYMLMTGVIFALLLSGLKDVQLTAVPWDNGVLHYIMPVVLVADWLLYPSKAKLSYKVVAVWAIVPIAYVAYSLIRGAAISWYPYPFLNATKLGYETVLTTTALLAIFVIGAALGLVWYSRWRQKTTR